MTVHLKCSDGRCFRGEDGMQAGERRRHAIFVGAAHAADPQSDMTTAAHVPWPTVDPIRDRRGEFVHRRY